MAQKLKNDLKIKKKLNIKIDENIEQAWAELGQAQPKFEWGIKLELNFKKIMLRLYLLSYLTVIELGIRQNLSCIDW